MGRANNPIIRKYVINLSLIWHMLGRLCSSLIPSFRAISAANMAEENHVESFKCLGVKDWLVRQCNAIGVKKPTEIQAKCIPEILKGRDCIACAKTGSGKTAVFALAILQDLCEYPYGVFALILTPTR